MFPSSVFEVKIPESTRVVFVSDFFASDIEGGAELTSEAIIEAATVPIFKLHARNLSIDLLSKNRDKFWIFGNFTQVKQEVLSIFSRAKAIKYAVIEYDFKFCIYRVPQQHEKQSGKPCDCARSNSGKLIEAFYCNAKKLFWMSEKQKDLFLSYVPSLKNKVNIVQTSTFSPKTISYLASLAETTHKTKMVCGVLSEGSWIKGVEQTQNFLKQKGIAFETIPKLPNHQFLQELAKFDSFAFMPADWDTCPRLVIEAALLGCDLILNENVLHKEEAWFKGKSPIEIESFLKERPAFFWNSLSDLL